MRKGGILEYLKNLTLATTKESSKRFIAIYITLGPISYIVLRYANASNAKALLVELILFVVSLLGVAAWENIKGKKIKQDCPDDPEI